MVSWYVLQFHYILYCHDEIEDYLILNSTLFYLSNSGGYIHSSYHDDNKYLHTVLKFWCIHLSVSMHVQILTACDYNHTRVSNTNGNGNCNSNSKNDSNANSHDTGNNSKNNECDSNGK